VQPNFQLCFIIHCNCFSYGLHEGNAAEAFTSYIVPFHCPSFFESAQITSFTILCRSRFQKRTQLVAKEEIQSLIHSLKNFYSASTSPYYSEALVLMSSRTCKWHQFIISSFQRSAWLPFIRSCHLYSAPSSPLLLRGDPDYSTNTVSESHAQAPQATAQGPNVAARAGVESTTLRLKVIDSTNATPRPTFQLRIRFIMIVWLCRSDFDCFGQRLGRTVHYLVRRHRSS